MPVASLRSFAYSQVGTNSGRAVGEFQPTYPLYDRLILSPFPFLVVIRITPLAALDP